MDPIVSRRFAGRSASVLTLLCLLPIDETEPEVLLCPFRRYLLSEGLLVADRFVVLESVGSKSLIEKDRLEGASSSFCWAFVPSFFPPSRPCPSFSPIGLSLVLSVRNLLEPCTVPGRLRFERFDDAGKSDEVIDTREGIGEENEKLGTFDKRDLVTLESSSCSSFSSSNSIRAGAIGSPAETSVGRYFRSG